MASNIQPRCARRRVAALLTGRNHHFVGMGAIRSLPYLRRITPEERLRVAMAKQ